jgi:hypothetical protein
MRKNGSIKFEVLRRLDALEAYGVSKRSTREQIADLSGAKYKDVRFPLIHSLETKEDYRHWAVVCVEWVRDRFGVKHLKDLKHEHVKAWLESRQANGDSPSTLKLQGASLAKLFGMDYKAFGFVYPEVSFKDFARGRVETDRLRRLGESHLDILAFQRAFGLRRFALEHFSLKHFRVGSDGTVYLHLTKEITKGGRERDVYTVREKWVQDAARLMYQRALARPDRPVIGRVDKNWNAHAERAWFGKYKYEAIRNLNRPREDLWVTKTGEVYDKVALWVVTHDLGHNRPDVVLKSYWYKSI